MTTVQIKDNSGRVIQVQKTSGTRTTAYTPAGKPLGYYETTTNTTYTQAGKPQSQGNTLAALRES